MARVIVLPNAVHLAEGLVGPRLFEERVDLVSLEDEDTSLRFIERVARAIQDADAAEMRNIA